MLCYSTGSLPNFSFTQIVECLKPFPFRGIELVITPDMLHDFKNQTRWTQAKGILQDQGFEITNIHLGYPHLLSDSPHEPGLGHPNTLEREKKVEAILKSIEIGLQLDAEHVTLTTGIRNEEEISLQENRVYECVNKIIENMSDEIKLGMEQEPEHIIHTAQQQFNIAQEFKGKFGLNFDVGHSEVLGENITHSLETLFPFIYNLHFEDISNNIHQHLLFGEGNIDFSLIFSTLKKLNYQGDMTPDLYPFIDDHVNALTASANFFAEYI